MGDFNFFNRDISWLSFNLRVLEEAEDKELPLYERIKYLAIYSSNLDEFYRVRVASVRSLLDLPPESRAKLGFIPEELLAEITEIVQKQHKKFIHFFYDEILKELKKEHIILHQPGDKIHHLHYEFIDTYFFQEVLPHIQPSLLSKGDIVSFLEDNVIYLAVLLFKKKINDVSKKKR
jgi:polyphosphate kinase